MGRWVVLLVCTHAGWPPCGRWGRGWAHNHPCAPPQATFFAWPLVLHFIVAGTAVTAAATATAALAVALAAAVVAAVGVAKASTKVAVAAVVSAA